VSKQQHSIVGQFFFSTDGSTLYHIVSDVNGSTYFLVESFSGLLPQPEAESRSVWALGKLTGLKLYPTPEAAFAASQKAAK
jgi:hypothetical protein